MTLAVVEKTLPMATIAGRTDRRTDRVRRNMRPPPREEGHIIIDKNSKRSKQCADMYIGAWERCVEWVWSHYVGW